MATRGKVVILTILAVTGIWALDYLWGDLRHECPWSSSPRPGLALLPSQVASGTVLSDLDGDGINDCIYYHRDQQELVLQTYIWYQHPVLGSLGFTIRGYHFRADRLLRPAQTIHLPLPFKCSFQMWMSNLTGERAINISAQFVPTETGEGHCYGLAAIPVRPGDGFLMQLHHMAIPGQIS